MEHRRTFVRYHMPNLVFAKGLDPKASANHPRNVPDQAHARLANLVGAYAANGKITLVRGTLHRNVNIGIVDNADFIGTLLGHCDNLAPRIQDSLYMSCEVDDWKHRPERMSRLSDN